MSGRLPDKAANANVWDHEAGCYFLCDFFSGALSVSTASAQTPSPEPVKTSEAAQLEVLTKKIDEQNAKIDALSQEILKLEQQISHIRPGVMVGQSTPSASTGAAPAESPSHPIERE